MIFFVVFELNKSEKLFLKRTKKNRIMKNINRF